MLDSFLNVTLQFDLREALNALEESNLRSFTCLRIAFVESWDTIATCEQRFGAVESAGNPLFELRFAGIWLKAERIGRATPDRYTHDFICLR